MIFRYNHFQAFGASPKPLQNTLEGYGQCKILYLHQTFIEADKPKPLAQFNFHVITFHCPTLGKGNEQWKFWSLLQHLHSPAFIYFINLFCTYFIGPALVFLLALTTKESWLYKSYGLDVKLDSLPGRHKKAQEVTSTSTPESNQTFPGCH